MDKKLLENPYIKQNYLVKKQHLCKICGTKGKFDSHKAPELMVGTGEWFEYFECSKCGCLQIAEIPPDLFKYYKDDYYSYKLDHVLFAKEGTQKNLSRILDVGCGAGNWLNGLASQGFTNLQGCDPFIPNDLAYENGIQIKKCEIHDIKGQFDLINLSASFEHMPDPQAVLFSIYSKLAENGAASIKIPIYPNAAFDMYGTYWYQLDAPRHLFLHSLNSIEYLCDKAGLEIYNVDFVSNNSQFLRSKLYAEGIPFWDQTLEFYNKYFSKKDFELYDKLSAEANDAKNGDMANFSLKKKANKTIHLADVNSNFVKKPTLSLDKNKALIGKIVELTETAAEAIEHVKTRAHDGKLLEAEYLLNDLLDVQRAVTKAVEIIDVDATAQAPLPETPAAPLEIKPKAVKKLKGTKGSVLDAEFAGMLEYVNSKSTALLVLDLKERLNKVRKLDKDFYEKLVNWYNWLPLWGSLNPAKNDYTLIENRARVLKERLNDFIWLYENLCDYRSRIVLLGVIKCWISFVPSELKGMPDNTFKPYFDLDLISCDKNEVFVDLGAYIGDTALDFIDVYGSYKKIYSYEIMAENVLKYKASLKGKKNVVLREVGVSSKSGEMFLDTSTNTGDANSLSETGTIIIKTVALDEDIKEPITFLKMDIEGAEKDAIVGAANHIKNDSPKLAISLYHSNEDIVTIPRMISEINPSYDFYLRYTSSHFVPVDYILIAIPRGK